ncbi:transaminase type I [Fusarium mundagurra]|uniref:Transaminase type I n=1 Tax=Fusarium mundagurra TaxID=1567541 RepID=A0A8H5YX56_9HYPO|nr:transaminase type I [Fusarium mundagurra]
MVRITPFAVEQWMDAYETTPGVLNVAETCAASVSIDDLVGMSSGPAKSPIDTSIKLTYGAIPGSQTLRERIAAHCSTESVQLAAEDVIVTQGAIGANFLALYTLIGPGDHVICVYPTYQQLYDTPRSLGAEITLWKLKKENGFVPDVDELVGLIKPNTKMIIINNPNNPSGVPIPSEVIDCIAKVAEEKGIILFSDEVYRPLFHGGASGGDHTEVPKPVTTLEYQKTIATGSMSKGYALAGIRVGWIASRDRSIISAIMLARDYTTISVSQIDDQVARFALSPEVKPALVQRNITLARTNAAILKEFMDRYKSVCSWVEPKAGTTAFIRFNDKNGDPVDDVKLCLDLLEKAKLLFVAGSRCFGGDEDFKGYVRMGYVCETDVLVEGLQELGAYIDKASKALRKLLAQCGQRLALVSNGGSLSYAAFALSTLHRDASQKRCSYSQEAFEYHSMALRELRKLSQLTETETPLNDRAKLAEFIAASLTLTSFEVFNGAEYDWVPHLDAVTAVVTMQSPDVLLQTSSSPKNTLPSPITFLRGDDPQFQADFSFLIAEALWHDILACVMEIWLIFKHGKRI